MAGPGEAESFLVTVSSVVYDTQEIDTGAAAKSRGVTAYKPMNGQFIVFYATATNVSFRSASMPSAMSSPETPPLAGDSLAR